MITEDCNLVNLLVICKYSTEKASKARVEKLKTYNKLLNDTLTHYNMQGKRNY